MNPITLTTVAEPLIRQALAEDITNEDVSTAAIMPDARPAAVDLIAKADGVLCGLDVFERTFAILDPETRVQRFAADGDSVCAGQTLATVTGDVRVLLSGERVALNYLQRMSGIATYTHRVAALLEGSATQLVDTRKTTPNMRVFEKEAVRCGGGRNHRYNLSDGVLLKDNHIAAAGGVREAIEAARAHAPFVREIEVECETFAQVEEAIAAGADIIMLDNMNHDAMASGHRVHRRAREDRVLRQHRRAQRTGHRRPGHRLRVQRRAHPLGAHLGRVHETPAHAGRQRR